LHTDSQHGGESHNDGETSAHSNCDGGHLPPHAGNVLKLCVAPTLVDDLHPACGVHPRVVASPERAEVGLGLVEHEPFQPEGHVEPDTGQSHADKGEEGPEEADAGQAGAHALGLLGRWGLSLGTVVVGSLDALDLVVCHLYTESCPLLNNNVGINTWSTL